MAAPPVVRDVTPRGATIGQSSTLRIVGANLQANPKLISSQLAIADQKVESASSNECRISFALAKRTPAGIYSVRVATDEGISAPVLIGVDQLPQAILTAGNEVSLPTSLTGALTGSTIVEVPFQGKKGQRVVIDVEAHRLAAKLNPVLRLVDERGTQIAWSGGDSVIAGDARIDTTLPADGRFRIRLHDKLYRGAGPGHFRLKMGDLNYANFVLPLGVQVGMPAKLTAVGNQSQQPASAEITVAASEPPIGQHAVWLNSPITGATPAVAASPHAELLESADGSMTKLPAAPVGVSGRLLKSGETDRFQLPVKAGEKLRIEMFSARLGAPVDGVIDVLRDNGQRLAGNDDQNGQSDPRVDFTVPGGVETITIAVRDMLGRGGDNAVYRLSVQPLGQPDFTLSVDKSELQLSAGNVSLIRVTAQRAGYEGPIQIVTHGLLADEPVEATVIPSGSNVGLLTIAAEKSAGAGTCVIEGRSVGDGLRIRRAATVAANDVNKLLPHLASEIGWATAPAAPLQLAWQLNSDQPIRLGDRVAVPVTVTRSDNAKGDVRLSLLTNQVIPKKKVKNEKTKKDEMVDDLDRTFRLEGTPVIAAGASEATVHVLTPPGVPNRKWDFVLRGELLSADKKNVVATTYAQVRSVASRNPLRLEVATSAPVEAKAGLGETGVLRGAVHRDEGFAHPVTLTLSGLPEGYTAESTTIARDKTDFEFPIRFQHGAKAGDLKNIRVVATAALDPKNSARKVRSNGVPVAIKVVPGEKPAE